MYYVIQEKLFREENYENLIRTLEKLAEQETKECYLKWIKRMKEKYG